MKPIIGVMPLWDDDRESIWMLPGYMDGISAAGGLPIIFPFSEDEDELRQLMDMCDGFLFTGGHDVSPEIYMDKMLSKREAKDAENSDPARTNGDVLKEDKDPARTNGDVLKEDKDPARTNGDVSKEDKDPARTNGDALRECKDSARGDGNESRENNNPSPLDNLIDSCKKRDIMESIVLNVAIADDKPVLGICRGIQFINARLGGTLYRDIPTEHLTDIEHHQQAPYDIPVHEVNVVQDSPLFDCLGVTRLPVNSYHHQAVRDVSAELEVMAVSTDGLVEAVYKPDQRFLWAVQWHPEYSYLKDINSRRIFEKFVEAARLHN